MQRALLDFQLLQVQLQGDLGEVCNALCNFLLVDDVFRRDGSRGVRWQQSVVQRAHGALHLGGRGEPRQNNLKEGRGRQRSKVEHAGVESRTFASSALTRSTRLPAKSGATEAG